jgi:hypothetical protein
MVLHQDKVFLPNTKHDKQFKNKNYHATGNGILTFSDNLDIHPPNIIITLSIIDNNSALHQD